MTAEDNQLSQKLAEAYRDVSPYPSDRQIVLKQLLTSAGYCEDAGSSAWSVTQTGSGYRLNVGRVEALTNGLTCMDRETFGLPTDRWFADFRILISGPDARELTRSPAWDGRFDPMNYEPVGEEHWCMNITIPLRVPPSDPDRAKAMPDLAAVQAAHRHYVAAAAHSPTGKLRRRSNFPRSHSAALVTCARREVAKSVASARYPDQIWNEELTVDGMPGDAARWDDISMFALTTNVYDDSYAAGAIELSKTLERKQEISLTVLRNALFDRQRTWRLNAGYGESNEGPDATEMIKIHQLLDEIRRRVADRRFD